MARWTSASRHRRSTAAPVSPRTASRPDGAGVAPEKLSARAPTTARRALGGDVARRLGLDPAIAVVLGSSDGAMANLGAGASTPDRGARPHRTPAPGAERGGHQRAGAAADVQHARARLDHVQPERILDTATARKEDVEAVSRRMVANGLRAELKTASYLTGQLVLSMQYVPSAGKADVRTEGDAVVIPSQGGGIDNILTAVSDFSTKLQNLPLDQIGDSLNTALRSAANTLGSVEGLVKKTDAGLAPTLRSLPQLTASLQDAVSRAGRVFGSLDASYGSNSSFNRELERAMSQLGDTARSVRVLADFLDRHPEALVRGRSGITQ